MPDAVVGGDDDRRPIVDTEPPQLVEIGFDDFEGANALLLPGPCAAVETLDVPGQRIPPMRAVEMDEPEARLLVVEGEAARHELLVVDDVVGLVEHVIALDLLR